MTGFSLQVPDSLQCTSPLPSGAVEIFCLDAYPAGLRLETAWAVTIEIPGESHGL